jgi:dienelactone hydrolase
MREGDAVRCAIRTAYCAIAFVAVSSAASAQSGGEAAFVFRMGADTIGIERFTSSAGGVSGEVLIRGQPRITYLAAREAAGRIGELYLVAYPAGSGPDASPLQSVRLRLVADTGVAEITVGGSTQSQRIPSKADAFLMLNSSFAMTEVALERMSGANRDSVTFPVLLASGGQTVSATARRVSPDSVIVTIAPSQSHLALRGTKVVRAHVPAQRLVVERVEGEAVRRLALGKPDYSASPGAPYRAEHVRIPAPPGHVLAGTLTIPRGVSGRLPVVITISGSGPQDRDEHLPIVPGFRPFRQIADTLGRRGIAVLRLDDRGTGESTGDFSKATSADFADDVRAAIAWLRARPDIDPQRIALLGHSEGAMIAPMVAATDPKLAGIVLMAGPSKRGREVLDHQIRYGIEHDSSIAAAKRDSAFAATRSAADTTAAPLAWMKFFLAYEPLPTIRKVKVPVLVLQGATDQQVTADQADAIDAALREAGNRDVTVRVLANRNHLFLPDSIGNPAGYVRLPSGKIGPDVMGEIVNWLVPRLQ